MVAFLEVAMLEKEINVLVVESVQQAVKKMP